MKCQNCGEHEANIKYMQMINGEKDEMYLCEKCAKDMKIDMNFDIIITTSDDVNYKGTLTLNLPIDTVIEEGSSNKELTDFENIVFKRV